MFIKCARNLAVIVPIGGATIDSEIQSYFTKVEFLIINISHFDGKFGISSLSKLIFIQQYNIFTIVSKMQTG